LLGDSYLYPGLIPRNQERLAKRVSNTIMESLLTPELQNLARRLLQPERVQKGILWLLRMALDQPQVRQGAEKRFSRVFSGFAGAIVTTSTKKPVVKTFTSSD